MSEDMPPFIYRGTTAAWPGNEVNQNESRTCATTDPLVATMFAIHSRNFGTGVVHVFKTAGYRIEYSGNCLADVEAEVTVPMTPVDFASSAVSTIEVDRAIDALAEMGIELPARLPKSCVRLTQFLQNEIRRLTPEEIGRFNTTCGVE